MRNGSFDRSARGWGRVIFWAGLSALGCLLVALVVDLLDPGDREQAARTGALLGAIVLGLAVPMLLVLATVLRRLARAERELERRASLDSLTALLNRGTFMARVERHLAERRGGGTHAPAGAMLLIDVDNLKSINDSHGHDRGDEALRSIARTITEAVRAGDLVGRVGGEEFAVFMPGATLAAAATVAERIRRAVETATFAPAGAPGRLSVSIGGAAYRRALPLSDLVRLADQQLYRAKHRGRNRTAVAEVAHDAPIPMAAA